jgi:putative RNA 2'-phosphotransferase
MEKHEDKSKFLSMLLRHKPDTLDLSMDKDGWISTEELLEKTEWPQRTLDEIVETDGKKRYEFSAEKNFIRAVQGHTIKVDLKLEKVVPPSILYHGTKILVANKIIHHGIRKMKRHHVHLSDNAATAREVGKRHKLPEIVFSIDAFAMAKDGFQFFVSKNGVFLVEHVPSKYLMSGLWNHERK